MVKTYGLTHISLSVRDPGRSLRFYRARSSAPAASCCAEGSSGPGLPFAYVEDPDGYEIEI